jgi:hypothetical protein
LKRLDILTELIWSVETGEKSKKSGKRSEKNTQESVCVSHKERLHDLLFALLR